MSNVERTRAYLYDLYVVPLWRNRFDQMFLTHVGLPEQGRMLFLECGTGGLALEVAHQIKDTGSVVATDTDGEKLELAQAKASLTKLENIRFVPASDLHPELTSNTYRIAHGDASLLPASRIEPMLRDLFRTIAEEGKVVLYTITRGSFDEFFSIYWEALFECGLSEELYPELEVLLSSHPTTDTVHEWAHVAGLRNIKIISAKEEFSFQNGEEFLSSPVIAGYWLADWFKIVPASEKERVFNTVKKIIDRDLEGQPFEISIKLALVTGDRQKRASKRAAPTK